MAEKVYTVYLQTAGEPETGIWCGGCSLPARVRFRLVAISVHGVSPWAAVERCLRCDGYDNADDADDDE